MHIHGWHTQSFVQDDDLCGTPRSSSFLCTFRSRHRWFPPPRTCFSRTPIFPFSWTDSPFHAIFHGHRKNTTSYFPTAYSIHLHKTRTTNLYELKLNAVHTSIETHSNTPFIFFRRDFSFVIKILKNKFIYVFLSCEHLAKIKCSMSSCCAIILAKIKCSMCCKFEIFFCFLGAMSVEKKEMII